MSQRLPTLFIAHGSPFLLDDAAWVAELRAWAQRLPRPKAILVVSAHWEKSPIATGATTTIPLVHDFYGFPPKYYDIRYPAPGAPELAGRLRELLSADGVTNDPTRGLDHGAYVPLVAMYPEADIPVLQLSLPTGDPYALIATGRRLEPLREEGVLLCASGFITHNMRAISWGGGAPPSWASAFDAWTRDALVKKDVDALVHYRDRAPSVATALPTHEHFVPLFVALGAALDAESPVSFPIDGFTYGSFTKRSVQFG